MRLGNLGSWRRYCRGDAYLCGLHCEIGLGLIVLVDIVLVFNVVDEKRKRGARGRVEGL